MSKPASNVRAMLAIAMAAGLMPFKQDDEMQKPPAITLQRTPEDDAAAIARAEAKRARRAEKLRRQHGGG